MVNSSPKMGVNERIALILETEGVDKVIKDFNKIQLGMKNVGEYAQRINLTGFTKKGALRKGGQLDTLRQTALLEKQAKVQDKLDAEWIRNQQEKSLALGKFRMQYLGVMFAGMAMQRVFGGMFKELIANYRKLGAKTNPLNIALTRLEANFTFLKYSIMEAASGPFTMLITGLAEFANWLAKIDPEILQYVAFGIAAIAGAGTIFYVGGQFMVGLQAFAKTLAEIGSGSVIKGLERTAKALAAFGGIASIGFGIYLSYKLLNEPDDTKSRIMDMIGITSSGTIAGGLLGFAFGGLPGAVLGAGVGFVIGTTVSFALGVLDVFWEEGAGIGDLWQAIKDTFTSVAGLGVIGASFIMFGPAGLAISIPLAVFFQLSINMDDKQADILTNMRGQVGAVKEKFDEEWAKAFEEGTTTLDPSEYFKEFGKDFEVSDGQSLGTLFGGDYSQMESYFADYETNMAKAQSILEANQATNMKNASSLQTANKNAFVTPINESTIKIAEFLKNDKDGGQSLLNLAANLDADFNKAFRNRTMTITIKYKEEDKPSGVGGFDDVNSGSTF